MPPLLIAYELIVLAFLFALLGIVLVNLRVLPKIENYGPASGDAAPKVAILVPARNEEVHIEACLRSLLVQDYLNFEVWLYDDGSIDDTPQIAARLAASDPRLHVVSGVVELPPGWLGKSHACHRLYEAMCANSMPDYVLFTDADVRFEPGAVSHAITAAQSLGAGLLSIFPRQITLSWAERLAVPLLLHWAVYSFLPLPLAHSKRTGPAFAAANGQFMLFTREAYEACGGHATVRAQVLEDVGLARAIKRAGYTALLADGGPLIQTRMYDGPGEVWRGYSKNAYAFFGYSPFFLATGIIVLSLLYISPIALITYSLLSPQSSALYLAVAMYVVAVVARLALAMRLRYRLIDTLLHPVAVLFLIAICINSMVWALTGRGGWKGRAASARGLPTARDQSAPTTRTGA
ncbi:MAG TPA: glycosyltransferase [Chloroflexia bacterium]|nr:glycosyltransferase [Chloroflexia bacterium]